MIVGKVNEVLEAAIQLHVQDVEGNLHDVQAVIDTGFTGFLTLPSAMIDAFRLSWLGYASGILGDGSQREFEVFSAILLWNGRARTVEVDAADTDPLIGMELLHGHELRIQVIEGGEVSIKILP